jgi:hypothetical protein
LSDEAAVAELAAIALLELLPVAFLALCRDGEDAIVDRHFDVTIRIHPWQLSPDHQMLALDEFLDLDVSKWPPNCAEGCPAGP